MRKVAKGNQEIFNKEIETLMLGYGAKETARTDRFIAWELETKAGLLTINLPTYPSYGFTVFSRFAEPEKANEVLGKDLCLNEYSGKYNFHTGNVLKKQIKTELIFAVDCFFSKDL